MDYWRARRGDVPMLLCKRVPGMYLGSLGDELGSDVSNLGPRLEDLSPRVAHSRDSRPVEGSVGISGALQQYEGVVHNLQRISSRHPFIFSSIIQLTSFSSIALMNMAQEDATIVSTSRKKHSHASAPASASEGRPYQCRHCDSTFNRIDHLKRHAKLRTDFFEQLRSSRSGY